MNEEIFSDLAIEKVCKNRFGLNVDIAEVIVRGVPTGIANHATIFKTTQGHVMLYITSQGTQLLDDVLKMVHRMQCEADKYYPPFAEADYFERIGRAKFRAMFPGKAIRSDEDLRYYRNLAPYNPALVRLTKVKGEIRAYDLQGKVWRKAKEYSYSKIRTI